MIRELSHSRIILCCLSITASQLPVGVHQPERHLRAARRPILRQCRAVFSLLSISACAASSVWSGPAEKLSRQASGGQILLWPER
jgi:hypothetical protein